MEEFDFDYHFCTTEYPQTGDRLQLGNSYVSTSGPTAPDQRIITLHFEGMNMYVDRTTGLPDTTTDPKLNFYRLELFYQRHKTWKSFNYFHVMYGMLVCKFNSPLKTPKPVRGTHGLLDGFTIDLLEIP